MAETNQNELQAQRLLYAFRSDWEPMSVNLRTDPMTIEFRRAEQGEDFNKLQSLIQNVDRVARTIGWKINAWRREPPHIWITAERDKNT